jgi:hypothetical protein
MKGFFNPSNTISSQFRNGLMGDNVLGYDEINMSQSIVQHTTGSRSATASLTLSASVTAQGATTVAITGDTGSATLKQGDVFTIANVYAVNPQTRQTTGSLQQFVVTADVTASSGAWTSVSVSPAIYTSANALATVDSFPASGAVVTMLGAASTAYPQNLVYHKDAITFATADLLLPQGVDMASRQVHNGISMRIVRQYDINNDRMPCRIDVLYGYGVIRAPQAVRLWG